jgi:sucrose phosphorylase
MPARQNHRVKKRLRALLEQLYGEAAAGPLLAELMDRLPPRSGPVSRRRLNQRDALLITYADQVTEPGVAPLATLADFCRCHLRGLISGVHLLPFYPWSSDDGFSVKDFFAVAPEYGTWADVARFRPDFDLMFDAVFNHASVQGDWFRRFLRDEPEFRDFFVTVDGDPDLSQVVRPRALPLLTTFPTARGPERVWTTFSADQADLNLKNPRVLLALLEALLLYVREGARFIRLDAIAYLWKEIGTPCIHLPQTHAVIQLFRAVLDEVAPHVQLITETNVPHADNLSYFGDGTNEAQLVYNFALPPLVLHALLRGNGAHLTRWAASLRTPSPRVTFFNFLASHDGIGLNPARGILPDAEIDFLVARCRDHGGFINEKHNADGSRSPYELNIVYFDAVNDPVMADPLALQVDRFMVAQAIMLALAGVPGIYFHSLFGSRNDRAAAVATGIHRRINRQKFSRAELEAELQDSGSLRCRVFYRFGDLLALRRAHRAFAPQAGQEVLDLGPAVFAVVRETADGRDRMLCLHNLTDNVVTVRLPTDVAARKWEEIGRNPEVRLPAYAVRWLAGM